MRSELIAKAEKGEPLGTRDVFELMSIKDAEGLEELYAAARRVRDKVFGKRIYTYGFVYFSTHCKNNCTFCFKLKPAWSLANAMVISLKLFISLVFKILLPGYRTSVYKQSLRR